MMLRTHEPFLTDATMALIAHLYRFMDEEDKANWSMAEAEKLVDDQYRYEIAEGVTPPYYSVRDFYEVIAAFIAQDA